MRLLTDEKILDSLVCPHCREKLRVEGKSLVCCGAKRHCFDFGGRGYVNFGTPIQSGGGDSKSAVRARSAFLNLGYYSPVAEAIARNVAEFCDSKEGIIIDAGCGEGYYSDRIAADGFSVIGADLSKFAVDAASKRATVSGRENSFFTVSSVFSLPVRDECASAVINVFAPCVENEYLRVIKNNGVLIVVSAGQDHLMGLKKLLYSEVHENNERADMPKLMEKVKEENIKFDIRVEGKEAIGNLFEMTPYYWRTSKNDAQKLDSIEALDTEIDMMITVYRKNASTKEIA
jgi:23S rRNA (guanine745-N1)-methyltransferase